MRDGSRTEKEEWRGMEGGWLRLEFRAVGEEGKTLLKRVSNPGHG
jgi:hypothetical protein